MNRPWAALVPLGLLMPVATSAVAAVATAGRPVMGTILQVTVVADDQQTASRLAEGAIAEAQRWDDILTTWRPTGELARLNARAGTGRVRVSADLATALRQMRRLARATGGAFDPDVGGLVRAWSQATSPRPAPSPPRHAGASSVAAGLTVQAGTVRLAPGAALDAGGIGKGIALDAMAAGLRAGGATAAFLDFGGSSQLAIGAPPGSPAGWRVLVAGVAPGSVHGVVLLRDAALSTSRATGAGGEAGPIVDPRTGVPVAPPRLATVRAPDATAADAWSTALVVLGRAGMGRTHAIGLDAFLEDADGAVATSRFVLRPHRQHPPTRRRAVHLIEGVSPHDSLPMHGRN